MCEGGVIQPLIHLGNNGTITCKIAAIRAIGILARSISVCRVIYEAGGLTPLLKGVAPQSNQAKDEDDTDLIDLQELRMQCARAIGNLAKAGPDILCEMIGFIDGARDRERESEGVIPSLHDLLRRGSEEGKEQAARTLEILTVDEIAVDIMINERLLESIVIVITEERDRGYSTGTKDHCLRILSGISNHAPALPKVQSALKLLGISREIVLTVQRQKYVIK
jgi:hypothetical protein